MMFMLKQSWKLSKLNVCKRIRLRCNVTLKTLTGIGRSNQIKNEGKPSKKINVIFVYCFFAAFLFFFPNLSFAQPNLPQRTLTVRATQPLHFGTFCVTGSGGGTITVGYNGSRTSSGDIALLAISPMATPAIFEVKLCEGRNIIITFNATTTLTGSQGSLSLAIGPTEKGTNGAIFQTNGNCDFTNLLRVGGTLTIPGTASSGTYSGNFNIIFNQE